MDRYSRQTILKEIGHDGQKRLLQAHVVVIGCGGLGSIAAAYLAGAGIGKITLIDYDVPEQTNLHRQVFFSEEKTNHSKSELLSLHIKNQNSTIEVNYINEALTKKNIQQIIQKGSIVLECTDHIWTKYLVNDYCHIERIPVVYGSIYKYEGYVTFFENKNDNSIHLRDIFEEPDTNAPTCSETGVIGTIAGLIGLFQANEAIKFITRAGSNLISQLLTYNCLSNEQMKLKLSKNYRDDLRSIYQNLTYENSEICESKKITIEEVRQKRKYFHLVSILEEDEHINIDTDVLRMPLSSFDIKRLSKLVDRKIVFYCKTGKRSDELVQNIHIGYSLIDGLKSIKN